MKDRKNFPALLLSAAAVTVFLLFLLLYGMHFAPNGITVHPNRSVTMEDARINVNSASEEDLEALPGIGPALSAAIVAYREAEGPFREPEDLLQVSGIGEKKLQGIRDLIRFDDAH